MVLRPGMKISVLKLTNFPTKKCVEFHPKWQQKMFGIVFFCSTKN